MEVHKCNITTALYKQRKQLCGKVNDMLALRPLESAPPGRTAGKPALVGYIQNQSWLWYDYG